MRKKEEKIEEINNVPEAAKVPEVAKEEVKTEKKIIKKPIKK
jgi:hypothetical protein